jgi:glycerophosphoryl diester phosphodiesterase
MGTSTTKILAVGHRGAAGIEPENTLRGFRRAIELGCDMAECDVHLTRDGQLAVIHDETVDRTTNGSGWVGEFTMAELKQLDAGGGERIPTLEEVLEGVRGRLRLLVELKGAGTEERAAATVKRFEMAPDVYFTSFHLERIEKIREIDPSLLTGAIFGDPPADACDRAIVAGAKSISVRYPSVTAALVQEAREKGLMFRAWNPDTAEDIYAMVALGVDGIGSNRPDILMEVLKRHGRH